MLLFIEQGRFRDPTFLGLTDRSIWSSYIQNKAECNGSKGKAGLTAPRAASPFPACPWPSSSAVLSLPPSPPPSQPRASSLVGASALRCSRWQRGGSHDDVVQQAYFCLGYRKLEPRLERSNLEPVILQDPGFLPWLSRCTEQYLLEAAAGLCTVDAEQNGPGVVHHPALAVVGGGANPPWAPGLRTRRLQSVLHAGAVARVVNSALRSLTLCLRMHSVLLVR